jgi:transposase
MMTKKQDLNRETVQMIDVDSLVPQEHLVRKVEKVIDFEFIRDLVKNLYSEDKGRPSIDPVVLVKIVFIQFLFGIRSMRQTIKDIEVNVAYRWFLGYGFTEPIPHFSTFGKNYTRRFADNELFSKIFKTILEHLIQQGLVKEETVFVDSTHIKAYANKRNVHNEYLEEDYNKYVKELHQEINEERLKEGKSSIRFEKTKQVAVSNVDPDCGMFHKGEKEKQLAYSVQTAVDEHGYVVGIDTMSASVNDNNGGVEFLDELTKNQEAIQNVVMDAGYTSPVLNNMLLNKGKVPVVPYIRPKGKKMTNQETKQVEIKHSKVVFRYLEEENYYLCPWLKKLAYKGIDSQGYKLYKTSKKDCLNCPFKHKCTSSDTKTITRHFLENVKTILREIRLSDFGKELYPKRKYTVERFFAQGKMSHCLGFTLVRGLKKNHDRNLIVCSVANIKKLALFVDKTKIEIAKISSLLYGFFHQMLPKIENVLRTSVRRAFLSTV